MATRGWSHVQAIVSPAKPPRARVQRPAVGRSKFGAVRTVIHGWTFASKAESARYQELLLRGEMGLIRNLELQPFWHLWVGGSAIDRGVCVGKYIADFRYERRVPESEQWEDVIEDVKGVATPTYRLKRKFVEALYHVKIEEIR